MRDRSKSDTRERRACGSPAYVLGAGDPLAPLLCRGTITTHLYALCYDRGCTCVVNMDKAGDEITGE